MRIALGLTIFVVVLELVGARDVVASLFAVDLTYVSIALVLVIIDALLRSLNWMQLLKSFTDINYRQAASSYLVGGFYGTLIPSTVGTDAARALTISRHIGLDLRTSAGSLITLNLIGLVSVGTVGLCAAGIAQQTDPSKILGFAMLLNGALMVSFSTLLFTALGSKLLDGVSSLMSFWATAERFLKPLFEALLTLPPGREKQISLIAVGVLNQILRVSVALVLARSLGISIDWWILAAIAPMIAIVEMVPLSFLGFGIGQGAMVYFLGQFGVPSSSAFTLSTMIASIYIAQVLVGGIPVLLGSNFSRDQAAASTNTRP